MLLQLENKCQWFLQQPSNLWPQDYKESGKE
jgi:hypothetical protein